MTFWSPDLVRSGTGGVPYEMRLRVRHWGLCYLRSAVSSTLRPPRPGSWHGGGMPMTCDGGRPSW